MGWYKAHSTLNTVHGPLIDRCIADNIYTDRQSN